MMINLRSGLEEIIGTMPARNETPHDDRELMGAMV